jgi:hypothetical protein
VLNRVFDQVRKIRFIADWLDVRKANREQQALHARLRAGLEEAKKRNANRNELDAITSQYAQESDIIWHPIYPRNSDKLVVRARKYGVRVPPQPKDFTGNDDWFWSSVTGDWFLADQAVERLNHEVRIEQRQSYDEFRKWATLGFAGMAFVLGVISLRTKNKQPDPCPKNYYRNDSGESVFALQKTETPRPQQHVLPQSPSTSPKPDERKK